MKETEDRPKKRVKQNQKEQESRLVIETETNMETQRKKERSRQREKAIWTKKEHENKKVKLYAEDRENDKLTVGLINRHTGRCTDR